MVNKAYYIELEFKEELTPNEKSVFDGEIKFWKMFKDKDGKYYTNDFEPKEALSGFLTILESEFKNILAKTKKAFFHYGEYCDNLIKEWKEQNYI